MNESRTLKVPIAVKKKISYSSNQVCRKNLNIYSWCFFLQINSRRRVTKYFRLILWELTLFIAISLNELLYFMIFSEAYHQLISNINCSPRSCIVSATLQCLSYLCTLRVKLIRTKIFTRKLSIYNLLSYSVGCKLVKFHWYSIIYKIKVEDFYMFYNTCPKFSKKWMCRRGWLRMQVHFWDLLINKFPLA